MADIEKLSWLKINGVEAPTPCEWTAVGSSFDSDDSVRDETGYLHRKVIRRNQHAPKFKWRLTGEKMSVLLNLINSESLSVSYFDLLTQKEITFTGYPQGTRTVKLILQKKTYKESWFEFECSFIEY